MKRKEHPTTQENNSKHFSNLKIDFPVYAWSTACEYIDQCTLSSVFFLNKQIHETLIETFSFLCLKRIKENNKYRILDIPFYIHADPMLMLLIKYGYGIQNNECLKKATLHEYNDYLSCIVTFKSLNFKKKDQELILKSHSHEDFFVTMACLDYGSTFCWNQFNWDYMLFALRDEILKTKVFHLSERFKNKMKFLEEVSNYKTGDPYPNRNNICNEKFKGGFDLETISISENIQEDIIGIFVLDGIDYGLVVLEFFTKNAPCYRITNTILEWFDENLGYSKSSIGLFTLISFTINALASFYFTNKIQTTLINVCPWEVSISSSIITHLVVILKANLLFPKLLENDSLIWTFDALMMEAQPLHSSSDEDDDDAEDEDEESSENSSENSSNDDTDEDTDEDVEYSTDDESSSSSSSSSSSCSSSSCNDE